MKNRVVSEIGMIETIRIRLVDELNIPVRGISIHRDGHLSFRVHILLPWYWILFSFIFRTKEYVEEVTMEIIEEVKPLVVEGRVTIGWFRPKSS